MKRYLRYLTINQLYDAVKNFFIPRKKDNEGKLAVWTSDGQLDSVNIIPNRLNYTRPHDPNKYIYVETTGNDVTGNGTQSNPYASITKAIEIGNQYSKDSYVRIEIGSGDFYIDELSIYGALYMDIYGKSDNSTILYVTSNNIRLVACGRITIGNVDIVCDHVMTFPYFIEVYGSILMLNSVNITSSVVQTNANISALYFSNCGSCLISSERLPGITGFHIAINADASIVRIRCAGEATDIAYKVNHGGVIIVTATGYVTPIYGKTNEQFGGKVYFDHLTNDGIITIYVSPTGDDRNWGQSATYAVKSVKRARDIIERIPTSGAKSQVAMQFANGQYDINEEITFNTNCGALVFNPQLSNDHTRVTFNLTSPTAAIVIVNAAVTINDITINKTVQSTGPAIGLHGCTFFFRKFMITATAPQTNTTSYGLQVVRSVGATHPSLPPIISNMYTAVYSEYGSVITMHPTEGTGNHIGYYSSGGIIIKKGAQPSAAYPIMSTIGGMVLGDTYVTNLGWQTLVLQNGATTWTGQELKCCRINGIVHLVGTVCCNSLASTTVAKLPASFMPLRLTYALAASTGERHRAFGIGSDGQITFTPVSAPYLANDNHSISEMFFAEH